MVVPVDVDYFGRNHVSAPRRENRFTVSWGLIHCDSPWEGAREELTEVRREHAIHGRRQAVQCASPSSHCIQREGIALAPKAFQLVQTCVSDCVSRAIQTRQMRLALARQ